MSNKMAGPTRQILLFFGLGWAFFAPLSSALAQTTLATFTVDKVKAAGMFMMDFGTRAAGQMKMTTDKTITVAAGDMPADVAKKIAAAFGDGVMVDPTNPAAVIFDIAGNGKVGAGFSANPNNQIGFSMGSVVRTAMLPAPTTPLADLAFLPNLIDGSDILATNSTIAAGFATGLSPVSFTAAAGSDLDQLASMLDSALVGGGYLTSMPDPTDVIVYAQGVSLPVEVDFSIDPFSTVGADGDIEIENFALTVPEPASATLLTVGLVAVVLACRKRPRARDHRM